MTQIHSEINTGWRSWLIKQATKPEVKQNVYKSNLVIFQYIII